MPKSKNFTAITVGTDVKEQLDNLILVVHGVPIKSMNDKLKYILYEYEHKKNL